MRFKTEKTYIDRKSKSLYVFDKYKEILAGKLLDVGADECHLKNLLSSTVDYKGIGMGGNPDIEVNLETQEVPFQDNVFDAVLCLDILEHLDNIHKVFDDLCRISKKYVIISLPNPYRDFLGMLFGSQEEKAKNFKYYGLPAHRPADRHKWFFSNSDAQRFIRERAQLNKMTIVQMDTEGSESPRTLKSALKRFLLTLFSFVTTVQASDFYYKTLWVVLEKEST